MPFHIGLDLGGTTISAGLVDSSGKVIFKDSQLLTSRNESAVVNQLIAQAKQVAAGAQIRFQDVASIGIGSPGLIDGVNGTVLSAANFPGWTRVALAKQVAQETGCPTFLENDASCAAAAEFWVGSGGGAQGSLFMLTLGTGVGGGLIINGQIVSGIIEPGHMILVPGGRACPCGQNGCMEQYCSATAVVRSATQLALAQRSSSLSALAANQQITCKDVFQHAQQGDQVATQVVEEAALHLAMGCLMVSRLVDPQTICLSGGMALAGEQLFSRVRSHFKQIAWTIEAAPQDLNLRLASAGNDAGLIGAAFHGKVGVERRARL